MNISSKQKACKSAITKHFTNTIIKKEKEETLTWNSGFTDEDRMQ